MKCPKCGYENKEDALCCNLCGLLFRKENPKEKPPELTLPKETFFIRIKNRYPTLSLLGVGLLVGAFLHFLTTKSWPLYCIFVYVLSVFFTHEVGHSVMGIIFGYFMLPAFTLYGGIAISLSYNIWVPILIIVFLTTLMIILRKEKGVLLTGVVTISLYSLFAFTYLKELLISAAGHLSTALIAGLFLIKGVFGKRSIEGLLWVGLGWFLVVNEWAYFIRLKTDEEFRQGYITGTLFDGHTIGDLAKISSDLNIGFDQIVDLFILIAIALPCLTLITARFLISRGAIDIE